MTIYNENYWNARYQEGATAWDLGSASPPLREFVDEIKDKNQKILIPGAGYGHEAAYLYTSGFSSVKVVDLSAKALSTIREKYPEIPDKWLEKNDFFTHSGSYDLILEQTFFCALEPSLREKYVSKMHSLLKPGGCLVGVLFNFEEIREEPPFGGNAEIYRKLFQSYFKIHKLENCYNSIKPRAGKELFFIFENK